MVAVHTAAADRPVVVTIGNPNTGKSSLFNVLTGLSQKVGNFPGVTVEFVRGHAHMGELDVELVDVPGTYSIAAQSPDELIAVDVLLGHIDSIGQPDAVMIVSDATNLRRNLFLASQILELGLPTIIALNMWDLATKRKITIDCELLGEKLGATVVPVSATTGDGLPELKRAVADAVGGQWTAPKPVNHEQYDAVCELSTTLAAQGIEIHPFELQRALIDRNGFAEKRLLAHHPELQDWLEQTRQELGQGRELATLEARDRYSAINAIVNQVEQRGEQKPLAGDIADRFINHPFYGTMLFVFVMAVVFQSVFFWATPLMDLIDGASASLSNWIVASLGEGLLTSFLADGVIAGVGSVVIFLPQIVILFAFIILLEDSGYMARAAFLMDRLMRWCGLSGQSFIPMLSSFACAVPGIMGTRVIANRSDRIATIIAAPFMTCSARLPVYALLIAAFVPKSEFMGGLLNLQGLVLLAFYFLGIVAAILTAFLLNSTILKGEPPKFLLELPPYRRPNWRSVLLKLISRAGIFLKRAGTIIFTVAIIVWALATFPQNDDPTTSDSVNLEQSYLGRASKTVAPLFSPLGWDWKVTAAVIASFPAREVVIAVLGTLYAIDDTEAETSSLIERIKSSTHPDGRSVFTVPMAFGVMVFFALCLQCASTIAIMRRETNTWRWPIFAWVYMTALGYLGALLCFQGGTLIIGTT